MKWRMVVNSKNVNSERRELLEQRNKNNKECRLNKKWVIYNPL